MRRKIVTGIVAGTLLVFSLVALAAPTAEQTAKINSLQEKMVESQKEMISVQLNAGLITQAQADRMLERLAEQKTTAVELTAEQQKALADAYAKQVELRKEMVAAQLEAGLITQEQADYMLKRIAAEAAYQQEMGFENYGCEGGGQGRGHGGGRGGRMGGGMMDISGTQL